MSDTPCDYEIDFEKQKPQHTLKDEISVENNNNYAIYHLIQVEGIKILSVNETEIPKNQKNRLSSENPKIIMTPYTWISEIRKPDTSIFC